MVACVKAMEMKLSRVLLASCINSNRIYLPFGASFYPKRFISAVSPYTSTGGSRTPNPGSTSTIYPLNYTKLGWYNKSYGNVRATGSCNQISPVLRRPPSAALRKETLLQGGALGHGKEFMDGRLNC